MRIRKRIFLMTMILLAILNCWLLSAAVIEHLTDDTYVEAINLPYSDENIAVPIGAGIAACLGMAIVHTILHIILSIISAGTKKQYITLIFNYRKLNVKTNICRLLSLLFIFTTLINYVLDFTTFYLFQSLFQLSLIVLIIAYMEWIVFLINKEDDI